MKKTMIATVIVSLFSTAVLATVANADTLPTTKETTGKIKFNVDNNDAGEIIKPDTETDPEEVIVIPEGNSSTGPLRIQFVPNFDFDEYLGISPKAMTAKAKPLTYTDKGEAIDKTVAPFVQVSDYRGLSEDEYKKDKWNLTVYMDEFKNTSGHELKGSTIDLKGSSLATTNGDQTVAESLVSGIASTDSTLIPIKENDAPEKLIVLKSLDKNTNGYQVSNVFSDNYVKDTPPADEIEGVVFSKLEGITPQADSAYVTTLHWTLEAGL